MTSAKIRLHDRRIMKMKSNTSLKSAVKIINNLRPLFLTQNVLLSFWISLFQNHGIYPYTRWKDSWRNMLILEEIFFFWGGGGRGAPSTTSSDKLQRGCHTCWKKQTNNKNRHSTLITSLHLRKQGNTMTDTPHIWSYKCLELFCNWWSFTTLPKRQNSQLR